ncbi:MAG: cell division topological specificity factor MinE [Clostridia bacterium]|nr:cell division topological specificity factor MinE [Clostridia bacterium]
MFEGIINFFKNLGKKDGQAVKSKDAAKERLHLVLMQDRANVSADFLDLMKQEIIEVIKKYIDVDENAIDVRLTNKTNGDGLAGAPALYANIPIVSIKEEVKNKMARQTNQKDDKQEVQKEEKEVAVEKKEDMEKKEETVKEELKIEDDKTEEAKLKDETKSEEKSQKIDDKEAITEKETEQNTKTTEELEENEKEKNNSK